MRFLFAVVWVAITTIGVDAAEPKSGWRGNGTGLWPDANPPLEWHRLPKGAMEGMRAVASPQKGMEPGDEARLAKGLVRNWLIVGPFPVDDSVKDFDRDLLDGESKCEPVVGQPVGDIAWKQVTAPVDDIWVFGTAELPFLDLAKMFGFKKNQIAYAHTYVFSPRGGPVRFVVDHAHGLKVWLNGKEIYRVPGRGIGLGFYTAISRNELNHTEPPSPKFAGELKPGWNRLLVKISTSNRDDYKEMRFCMRISDPPDVNYDSKNIQWMTPLPGRSTSTPIMVGDKLFVLAEPDEILCIDKNNGGILWSAFTNYYEAMTPAEKQAKPKYAEVVDPLVSKLKQEKDRGKRRVLRAEIQKAQLAIDVNRFKIPADGHFESHFGIVGFTMPTPVCDGKQVYVWNGTGVAACFDLEGKRKWITRIKADELSYGSSPALVDGVLAVFQHGIFGLDAATGRLLWQQKRIKNNVAALQGAFAGGKPVIVTQRGDLIRPSDGEILYRPKDSASIGDTGWSPSVIVGNKMYQPRYGVTSITVFDLSDLSPSGEPRELQKIQLPETVSRKDNGGWIDRWTAGSPLVCDGFVYQTDIYHSIYAVELATGMMYYRREMPLDGLMHYNAVPVAASPTLIGKHIFLCDNQGNTLVIPSGPSYRRIAQNKIGTVLDRAWPIPSQETLTYSPPLADGNRVYLRGEAYLYCIGEK